MKSIEEQYVKDSGDKNAKMHDRNMLEAMKLKSIEEQAQTKPTLIPWPKDHPKRRNACNEECDTWTGPCVCGAWHKEGK